MDLFPVELPGRIAPHDKERTYLCPSTKEELDFLSFWLLVQDSPGFGKENYLELGRRRSRIHFECHVGDAC